MLRTDGFVSEHFRFRKGKAASYRLPLQPSRVGVQGWEEEGGEGCGSTQGGGRGQVRRVREGSPGAGGSTDGLGSGRVIWGHLVFQGDMPWSLAGGGSSFRAWTVRGEGVERQICSAFLRT